MRLFLPKKRTLPQLVAFLVCRPPKRCSPQCILLLENNHPCGQIHGENVCAPSDRTRTRPSPLSHPGVWPTVRLQNWTSDGACPLSGGGTLGWQIIWSALGLSATDDECTSTRVRGLWFLFPFFHSLGDASGQGASDGEAPHNKTLNTETIYQTIAPPVANQTTERLQRSDK